MKVGKPAGSGKVNPLMPSVLMISASTRMNCDNPRVAIMPIRDGRPTSRRTTPISISAARPPATAIAIGKETQYGAPWSTTSRPRIEAPKAPIEPWAKLTNLLDR